MQAINIKKLSKTYEDGTQALTEVDLSVAVGDFAALLGVNGAGKTTTIGILTGLVKKTSGQVSVFGFDLDSQLEKVKEQIGVVPQEMNFNIFENVIDIVVNQAGYYGIPRKTALAKAEEILKKLNLWDKRHAKGRELSGGMKRRLMIARALIHEPRLLILDEPTAGVDVELRRGMWDYLQELNTGGVTILLTTHYLEEVEQLCKNASVINKGSIILSDSVRNLMSTVESEVYLVNIESTENLKNWNHQDVTVKDENTLEISVHKDHSVTEALKLLEERGVIAISIRPKSNRMEELFLNAVKQ